MIKSLLLSSYIWSKFLDSARLCAFAVKNHRRGAEVRKEEKRLNKEKVLLPISYKKYSHLKEESFIRTTSKLRPKDFYSYI